MIHQQPKISLSLSGALGVIIVPDRKTIEKAYEIAQQTMPDSSEYVISVGSLPHLTLHHCKLSDVPRNEVLELVNRLRSNLVGAPLSFSGMEVFSGKFLFWNLASIEPKIADAHLEALTLAKYLERNSPAMALSDERLSLTNDELENVSKFGHPLVRGQYRPHITLGFSEKLKEQVAGVISPVGWSGVIESVEFARIGFPGRVEEILSLNSM